MGWWRIWSPDSPYTKGTPATGGKYYEAWLSGDSATDLVMMLRLITGDTWYCNEMEDMRDSDYIHRSGYDEHTGKDGRWMAAENWGGDPEGKLAKALERARKKAKQPRKPLKIERLKAESHQDLLREMEKLLDDDGFVEHSFPLMIQTQEKLSTDEKAERIYNLLAWHGNEDAYMNWVRANVISTWQKAESFGAEAFNADEKRINGMTLNEWLDEIDRIKSTKKPHFYANDFLGSPKYDNRIDFFWEQGWSPQGILHVWKWYDNDARYFEKNKAWKKMSAETFNADYYYDGDRRSGFSIVKGGFKYGKDRIGGTTLATITKGNALQAQYWKGDEASARRDANRTMWEVHLKENNVHRSFSKRQDAIDFVFSTLGISKEDMEAESFGAEAPSYMADSDAHKLMEASWRINSFVESTEEYPQWWKSRLSVAASNVDDLADYLDYAMSDDYEAEENQYEFWSVWENDDDYDSVSDFDTEQEAIDFYEKMIKKHGEDSYLLFGNDGKGGVVELEVVFEAESLDAETFNASIKRNPYSVDLYEDEDTPPYYPYLAPEYTNVVGRGRYRFNRYGTDGMTHEQYRFTTKDKAIEWLCYTPHQWRWVKPNQPQYDFPPNTPDSEIKVWYRTESFGAENSSLAKRSWDALNNIETAVGTVGLAHMIGFGAIFGGGLAFLKGRKSNSKTEK